MGIAIHFSEYFGVDAVDVEDYGAFNISLINDLPLFIDPFLLFNSDRQTYRNLHDEMISYLSFLRDRSISQMVDDGLLRAWYTFPEVRQNWLGFCKTGNRGSGLGMDFARNLNQSLDVVFSDFGNEKITAGSHLEKVCLIRPGVGRDNISDFTANLIKHFLAEYTQEFARTCLHQDLRKSFPVSKAIFNYETETWQTKDYELPDFHGDYVLLTPKDILTRDEIWINQSDLFDGFDQIAMSVGDQQLRSQLENYLKKRLPENATSEEWKRAVLATIREYPEVVEYYIRLKEDSGDKAVSISKAHITESEMFFIYQALELATALEADTGFFDVPAHTLDETRERVEYLKSIIEDGDGYRVFYLNGKPVGREHDLQVMFRLTWCASRSDVSPETNAGRGPVDFKISRGAADKTLVEFKLAKNKHLKRNLQKQLEIYKKAHHAEVGLKVILFFTEAEEQRVHDILGELGMLDDPNVVLIDARNDNKPSASRA